MYSGKSRPGQPNADLVRAEAEELWKSVKKGWNTNGDNIRYGSMEQRLLIQMRYNTFVTSVFKRHHYALDMARELFDEKGNIRTFEQFNKAVKGKIDPDYNKKWLRTEYNTAYASGQMARKWQGFVKKGGYLVYVAVMDNRVRPDHAGMNGARYPVDHEFWRNHYPPNGWNCRCTVRWDGTDGIMIAPDTIEDVPKVFQTNVGVTGQVFKDSPYFTVDGQFREQADKLFGFKPPVDPERYEENLLLYNRIIGDKNYKLTFVDNLSGGFVFKHVKTEVGDVAQNVLASKALARRGDSVIIRDVIPQHGVKNPDILLNGVVAEVKTNNVATMSAVDNALRAGKRQAGIIVLNVISSIDTSQLELSIYNRVRRAPAIKTVIIVYNNVVYELTAEEIIAKTFFGKIGK